MEIEKAKDNMMFMVCGDCWATGVDCGGECKQTMHLICDAVDKQIPKKPTPDKQKLFYELCCPVCGNVVWKFIDNFCSNCGQKIDWRFEND